MYEIIEKLIKVHNISIYKLAKDVGITPSLFSHWKNGQYQPKIDKVQKIADYFGVPAEYILTGKEPDNYYENDEVAQIAQAVYERPELKVLFDASRDSTKEDIEQVIAMLDYLKKKENKNE